MALPYFAKTATFVRSKTEQEPELQVDFSYTQWRHAQMLQQERNYRAACESIEGIATI